MSAMNDLQLADTDESMKEQGINLTELESTLIAKAIVFKKIYHVPK